MAVGVDMEKFHKMLECSICLELYTNPKILKCDHEFCKQCIEDIAVFLNDGSATITCPFRCEKPTVLDKNQTVDDLGASYVFKNILEALKSDKETSMSDPQRLKCGSDANCGKPSSVFYAGKLTCISCYNHHMNMDPGACKVDVALNHRKDKLMVVCQLHQSVCTHLCVDGTFLCVYCLHRDHQHHAKNEVDTEVHLLREAMAHAINESSVVNEAALSTMHNIVLAEEKLRKLLKQRKKLCLSRYKLLLDTKEKTILEQFETLTSSYVEQYSSPRTEYYETILKRIDIEVLLLKADILKKLDEDRSMLFPKRVNVALSQNWNYLTEEPLGDLLCLFNEDKRKMKSVVNSKSAVKHHDLKSRPLKNHDLKSKPSKGPRVKSSKNDDVKEKSSIKDLQPATALCDPRVKKHHENRSVDVCGGSVDAKDDCTCEIRESGNLSDPNVNVWNRVAKISCASKNPDANDDLMNTLDSTSGSHPRAQDNHVKTNESSDINKQSRTDSSEMADGVASFSFNITTKLEEFEIPTSNEMNNNTEPLDKNIRKRNYGLASEHDQESGTIDCDILNNKVLNKSMGSTGDLNENESLDYEIENVSALPEVEDELKECEVKNSSTSLDNNAVSFQEILNTASARDVTEFDLDPGGMDELNSEWEENKDELNDRFCGNNGESKLDSNKNLTTLSSAALAGCVNSRNISNEITMIKESEEDIDTLLDSLISKDDSKCNIHGNCRNPVSVVGQKCNLCFQMFCLTHRLPEVHGCGKAAKIQARKDNLTEGRKTGKSSDAKKKAKLRNKLSTKLSKLEDKRKKK